MSRRQRRADAWRPAHWLRNPARGQAPRPEAAEDPRAVMIEEASPFIRNVLDAYDGPAERLVFLLVHRDHERAAAAPATRLIHRFPSGNLIVFEPVDMAALYALQHGGVEVASNLAQPPPVPGCVWCFVLAPDVPPMRAALGWVDRMPTSDTGAVFFTRGGTA